MPTTTEIIVHWLAVLGFFVVLLAASILIGGIISKLDKRAGMQFEEYPTEAQMLASIFEAIFSKRNFNFERTGNQNAPLFVDSITEDRFSAFLEGFEFSVSLHGHSKIKVH